MPCARAATTVRTPERESHPVAAAYRPGILLRLGRSDDAPDRSARRRRRTRLVSVAAQRFVAGVLDEALNVHKRRKMGPVAHLKAEGFDARDKRLVLTTEDLAEALREARAAARQRLRGHRPARRRGCAAGFVATHPACRCRSPAGWTAACPAAAALVERECRPARLLCSTGSVWPSHRTTRTAPSRSDARAPICFRSSTLPPLLLFLLLEAARCLRPVSLFLSMRSLSGLRTATTKYRHSGKPTEEHDRVSFTPGTRGQ
jgi:hypothetical protein